MNTNNVPYLYTSIVSIHSFAKSSPAKADPDGKIIPLYMMIVSKISKTSGFIPIAAE